MRTAIDGAYEAIAAEQGIPIAPVGRAWAGVVNEDAKPGLWQDDGSHPTAKGTYLAACVLYAAIFRQSPVGLGYHPWISGSDALEAQKAAADIVLGLPAAGAAS